MSDPKREGALALQMDGERCNNVCCVAPGAFGDGGSGAGSIAVAQPAPPTATVKYEFPTNDWPQLPGEVNERKHVPVPSPRAAWPSKRYWQEGWGNLTICTPAPLWWIWLRRG